MENWITTGLQVRFYCMLKQQLFVGVPNHGKCKAQRVIIAPTDMVAINREELCCTNVVVSVLGWLDDIGLPQYKTQFDEGKVDGRMLHYMSVVSKCFFFS